MCCSGARVRTVLTKSFFPFLAAARMSGSLRRSVEILVITLAVSGLHLAQFLIGKVWQQLLVGTYVDEHCLGAHRGGSQHPMAPVFVAAVFPEAFYLNLVAHLGQGGPIAIPTFVLP